jgi:uncharacterized 2Fe-2S/4Fe-4S cluster protein (DUF4445 family)
LSIRVLFNPINRELTAEQGDNLLDRMREEGIRIEALCGGKGLCGKCKVILEQGRIKKRSTTPDKFLSHAEIEQGYHLACMVQLIEDCVFTIPTESRIDNPKILLSSKLDLEHLNPASKKYLAEPTRKPRSSLLLRRRGVRLKEYDGPQPRINDDIYEKLDRLSGEGEATVTVTRTNGFPEIIDAEPGDTRGANYGLAIDIGTTTVVAILVNLTTGDILGTASGMNRQITYGEDLITRIVLTKTKEGLNKLQSIVVETINDLIDRLTEETGVDATKISEVSVGGNTVMNHLFAGLESYYLEMANIEVSRDPIIVKARDLGLNINPEAYAYCVPNVSRFLGGDAIGDVLAGDMHKSEDMSLMVDLGTNGEVVFGNSSWLFSASCASGPAFEGEGVRHGMRAAAGGIDHIKIDDDTKKADITVIGDSKPKGIVGSGLIDLVAELFRVGILDFAGKLVPGSPMVREGKWGLEYLVVQAEDTGIGKDIVLTQADLDYVIDSKAAACGGITVLMKKLRIGIEDVKNIYLAGAFGTFTNLDNATLLGIFPEFPNATVYPIGNGSLSGAYATLMSMEKRREAREVAQKMVYVDLLVDIEFIDEYSMALYLPGAKKYFPTLSGG